VTRAALALLAGLLVLPLVPVPAKAEATAPVKSGMNSAVLAKLLALVARAGRDTALPPAITAALGLPGGGKPWPDRQFAVQSHDSGALHAIAVGEGDGADIILSVKGPAAISIFRADHQGALISATSFFPETGLTMTPPTAASKTDYAAECAFWAIHIEDLAGAD
jgi:hypothetical protein